MALPTYSVAAEAAGTPAGDYVPAAVAQQLEQTLSKLTWQVLYGKASDASSAAVSAERLLASLSAPAAA